MQQAENISQNVSQSGITKEKELVNHQQLSYPPSNQNNERSLVGHDYLVSKLEKSLKSSIDMLEKCIEGIDGGKDDDGEEMLVLENIDAAHKLIDMTVKIIAVKERLK